MKKGKRGQDRFTWEMFQRLFFPSLFSSVGLALSDMADAVVVGQRLGTVGLAAISISLPLYMIINVFMHGLGLGGSVKYSSLLGEGKSEEAVACFNRTICAALFISIILACIVNFFPEQSLWILGVRKSDGELYQATLDYVSLIALGAPLFFLNYILNYFLRNDENQKLAGIGFMIGNAVDIALNIVFVLLLDGGIRGAAWATLIGLLVSIICYIPGILGKKHTLAIKWVTFAPVEVARYFKTGLATSSQYLFQMFFLLIGNHILMATFGEVGVAVFDMIQNASYLTVYLYDGTAKAMQPLVSTYAGEKNRVAAKRTLFFAMVCGLMVGAIAIAFLCGAPEAVCLFFGIKEAEAIKMGTMAIRIYCMGASLAGTGIILESYYQAMSDESGAFFITLLRTLVVLIPATVVFAVFCPNLFWWIYPVTEAVSLVLFLGWYLLFHKKREQLDSNRIFSRTIQSRTEDIPVLTEQIEAFCEAFQASTHQKYFVTMSAEEICLAIINQGFATVQDGVIELTLIALEEGEFELHIRDNATSFNPFSLQTKKAGEEEDFDMDAMGILVIKKRAKHFFYRQYQGFNSLVVKI